MRLGGVLHNYKMYVRLGHREVKNVSVSGTKDPWMRIFYELLLCALVRISNKLAMLSTGVLLL